MKRFATSFLALICLALIAPGVRANEIESAVREPDESYESASTRYNTWHSWAVSNPNTAQNRARAYSPKMDLSVLPEWTAGQEALMTEFVKARDARVYVDKSRPDFLRRSTWLYPRDGCYARAGHIAGYFAGDGFRPLGRIFAFGHLKLQTRFEKGGWVYWWYHVAVATRIGNAAYVLDPAIDLSAPIPFAKWVAKMSATPSSVKIAVCDANAYIPSSNCIGGLPIDDEEWLKDQLEYLPLEWNKLASLGMKPLNLLGESPPWRPVSDAPAE